jgi:hypothetical protein
MSPLYYQFPTKVQLGHLPSETKGHIPGTQGTTHGKIAATRPITLLDLASQLENAASALSTCTLFRPRPIFRTVFCARTCRLTPQSYPDPAICSKFGYLPDLPSFYSKIHPQPGEKLLTTPTIPATLSVTSFLGPGDSTGGPHWPVGVSGSLFSFVRRELQQLGISLNISPQVAGLNVRRFCGGPFQRHKRTSR